MNALTVATPHLAYAEMERLAADMATSGLFGFKTKQEAMSIMMIAHAEGKHPATAARDYDVINKKLAKRAEAMMRDFMEGGGKVKWHALTDALADATFTHPQGGEVRISWDMERALQAGLSTKENWRKYPRQMLRNRTVSEGVRTVWPLATSGLYEPGEVADFTGKTIEAEPDTRDTLNAEVPLKAVASATPRGARIAERAPTYEAPPPKKVDRSQWTDAQWQAWVEKFGPAVAVLYSRQEVVDVAEKDSVKDALQYGSERVREEVSKILSDGYKRFPEDGTEAHEPETEDVA
jgi:hypothetical protein